MIYGCSSSFSWRGQTEEEEPTAIYTKECPFVLPSQVQYSVCRDRILFAVAEDEDKLSPNCFSCTFRAADLLKSLLSSFTHSIRACDVALHFPCRHAVSTMSNRPIDSLHWRGKENLVSYCESNGFALGEGEIVSALCFCLPTNKAAAQERGKNQTGAATATLTNSHSAWDGKRGESRGLVIIQQVT